MIVPSVYYYFVTFFLSIYLLTAIPVNHKKKIKKKFMHVRFGRIYTFGTKISTNILILLGLDLNSCGSTITKYWLEYKFKFWQSTLVLITWYVFNNKNVSWMALLLNLKAKYRDTDTVPALMFLTYSQIICAISIWPLYFSKHVKSNTLLGLSAYMGSDGWAHLDLSVFCRQVKKSWYFDPTSDLIMKI